MEKDQETANDIADYRGNLRSRFCTEMSADALLSVAERLTYYGREDTIWIMLTMRLKSS